MNLAFNVQSVAQYISQYHKGQYQTHYGKTGDNR